MNVEPSGKDMNDDVVRSGTRLAAPKRAAPTMANEDTLRLLEAITCLLQSNEPDESALLGGLVAVLHDVGFVCTVDVERKGAPRLRCGVPPRTAQLDDLIDRQVERAQHDGRALWCCREPIAPPHGVSEHVRDLRTLDDLVAIELDWILSVPFGDGEHGLGALTVYGSLDGIGFPSVAFVRNVARLVGTTLVNRRRYVAMKCVADQREIAMASVAHDIRHPLGVIMLMSRLIRPRLADQDDARHNLDDIERHVKYAVTLAHDILECTAPRSANFAFRPCDSGALVAEALSSFESLFAEKSLVASSTTEPGLPAVQVDRDRILRVLLNLVGNAIKFTPRKGKIDVRVERHAEGAAFSVTDTGPGMSPEQIAHAFDPFWQADTSRPGAGLGLTIVHDIVHEHGGKVWVESALGRGAKFVFTTPLAS